MIPLDHQNERMATHMKLDPIIAVKDVSRSAKWYCKLLGLENMHGGDAFAVLRDREGNVVLCLHTWGSDEHPTMLDSEATAGNGMILYFRLANLDAIHEAVNQMDWPIEEELHRNPNSRRVEFSLRDPDGYFLTITELHQYEG